MADLGEFGRARAVAHGEDLDPDSFRFHGERFEVPQALSPLVLMEFAYEAKVNHAAHEQATARQGKAQGVLDQSSSPAQRAVAQDELTAAETAVSTANTMHMAAMYSYIRECIGDAQWPRFRAVVLREAVDDDELMDVCADIFSAVAGRPTRRPSGSSDGPSSTGVTSTDGSDSPGATPGQALMGQVLDIQPRLTEAEEQMRQFRELMVPVDQLTRSGS